MLKDNIVKSFNIQKFDKDLMQFNFRGELDVKGHMDGQLVYHDGGDNTITTWAKHSMIHALTGDEFTAWGSLGKNTPLNTHAALTYVNPDGNCISNKQYWWSYADLVSSCPPWTTPNAADTTAATLLYSILPTKILFGTGRESDTWGHLTTQEQSILSAGGWTGGSDPSTGFETGIASTTDNYYSGTLTNAGTYGSFSGAGTITNSRTFTDPLTAKLVGTPDPGEFGVQGAIKDSLPGSGVAAGVVTRVNTGIGNPNFLYFQRDFTTRWASTSSEVYISSNTGDNYEHKITYSMTMPSQTDTYLNWYYPYNGFTLKVAGLFSDSRLVMGNNIPPGQSAAGYYQYTNMPSGIMFAKRYISPITKVAGLQLSIQWTIYI